ncbi:MAG: NAD(P)/FAD-dependent oxidoreductase [Thermodesulfobacteriota bacterium]
MRILIIGAGAAGISAAETIKNHKADAEITIITKDKCPPYSPVALPDYIEGRVSKEQMVICDDKFIREKRIDLLLGRTVITVNPDKRTVETDDGAILTYDKLLIASGASPVLTKDLERRKGVFTLRTLEDADAIRQQISGRAVIFGAGAVAVKLAVALQRIGIEVLLLCRTRVLRRLFDEDISQLIHDLLTANGVKVLGVGKQTLFIGDPIKGLRIGTQEFKCDGVIAALGIIPNTSFLSNGKIHRGLSGGIITDGRMQTLVEDIYAAGDCAETVDITSGKSYVMALWPPAVEQGKVAALNMLGIGAVYDGTLPENVVDIFGIPFVSIGSLDGEKIDIGQWGTVSRFTINKEGKITGCQLVGNIDNAGLISSFIRKAGNIKDLKNLNLIATGRLSLIRRSIVNTARD